MTFAHFLLPRQFFVEVLEVLLRARACWEMKVEREKGSTIRSESKDLVDLRISKMFTVQTQSRRISNVVHREEDNKNYKLLGEDP